MHTWQPLVLTWLYVGITRAHKCVEKNENYWRGACRESGMFLCKTKHLFAPRMVYAIVLHCFHFSRHISPVCAPSSVRGVSICTTIRQTWNTQVKFAPAKVRPNWFWRFVPPPSSSSPLCIFYTRELRKGVKHGQSGHKFFCCSISIFTQRHWMFVHRNTLYMDSL